MRGKGEKGGKGRGGSAKLQRSWCSGHRTRRQAEKGALEFWELWTFYV